jgi:hypothetical protein
MFGPDTAARLRIRLTAEIKSKIRAAFRCSANHGLPEYEICNEAAIS